MMLRCFVVCLVGGLLAACIFVFLASRYPLSFFRKVEHYQEQNVVQKSANMSSSEASDSGATPVSMRSNIEDIRASVLTKIDNIPAIVLSKVDNIWVFEKTAKFSIRDRVRLVATAC